MQNIFGLLSDPSFFYIWGISGITILFLGCIISSIFFRGRYDEKYSPLNHYISELGEKGISKRACFFNTGLIAGGILSAIFIIQLGRFINTVPALIFVIIGVIDAISCVLVGFFPMNNLKPHMVTATLFFYSGMFTVITYGITSIIDNTRLIPEPYSILAIIVSIVFFSFLATLRIAIKKGRSLDIINKNRSKFSLYPFLEWVVMLSMSIWILAISIYAI